VDLRVHFLLFPQVFGGRYHDKSCFGGRLYEKLVLEIGVIRNRVLEVGHVRNLFGRPVPFEIVFWISVAWETGFRRWVSSEIVFWEWVTYDFVCLMSGPQKSFERNSRTRSILTFGNSKLQPKKRYAEKLTTHSSLDEPKLSGMCVLVWPVKSSLVFSSRVVEGSVIEYPNRCRETWMSNWAHVQ